MRLSKLMHTNRPHSSRLWISIFCWFGTSNGAFVIDILIQKKTSSDFMGPGVNLHDWVYAWVTNKNELVQSLIVHSNGVIDCRPNLYYKLIENVFAWNRNSSAWLLTIIAFSIWAILIRDQKVPVSWLCPNAFSTLKTNKFPPVLTTISH